ncbi:MAG: hypothetical protein ABS876_04070 [Ruminococcus sp.]
MKKMNRLYTAAFVLALACVPFGLAAMAAVYLFQKTELAVLFGAVGALCAFVGIVLAYVSKPKKTLEKTVDSDSEV